MILPGAKGQPVYWAVSEFDDLGAARRNLKEREGCALKDIHSLPAADKTSGKVSATVTRSVRGWLAARKQVDAVIWTGLTTNWQEKRHQKFTSEDAVRYLKGLESERDRSATTFGRAQEYVMNTPALIQTKVRRAMQKEGWKDTVLSKTFFEDYSQAASSPITR